MLFIKKHAGQFFPGLGLKTEKNVFHDRHLANRAHILEGAGNAQPGYLMGWLAQYPGAAVYCGSAVWRDKPGYHIKQRTFAGAVGSDESENLLFLDFRGKIL